ncbi:MAG TPA: xanthine dehydrogenase family protein subunit M [Firmicutes bacterium]|nr:xanthine dehydrogenase family protein subunit M [Bacillota bacterium]
MVRVEEYFAPGSLEEAIDILNRFGGTARVIAGGTDLIPELREGAKTPRCLVDVKRISGLREIAREGDWLRIGAAVTHAEVAEHPLVRELATALAEAAAQVGSPQVRNLGTVAGNVVNAQPAADTAIALVALGGVLEVASAQGTRLVPVEDCYQGVGVSRIDSTREVVAAVRVRCSAANGGPKYASAFERLARRKALALPVINVAVWVAVEDGVFRDVRVAVGPVAPYPFRVRGAEDFLRGQPIAQDTIARAAAGAASEANPRSSPLRGPADYRREMVEVLVTRALMRCWHFVAIANG